MSQFLKVPPATGVIILASSLFFSEKALAQAFFLSFEEGPSALCAEEGSITSTVHCMLGGSQGSSGAEGWAIGVTAPGHRIVDLTVAGTAAERALATGFVLNELTSGEGNDGAVSFVALSFGENSALPPNTLNRILALKVEASPGDLIGLEFVDGLQSSAGTVSNIVHVGARGFVPARRSGSFRLVKGPHFGFSMKNVDSSSLYEEIVGGKAASGVVELLGLPGGKAAAHVYPCLVSDGGDNRGGIQGWSLTMGLEGDAEITSATTEGTTTDRLFRGGFNKTEVIDPARNNGQRGVVSAVVLSFTESVTLPEVGTYAILDLRLEADLSRCDGDCTAKLALMDGLRGTGQPFQNTLTISGDTVRLCNGDTASVTLRFTGAKAVFLRGNTNGDARVDLADVLFIFAQLFTGGPIGGCRSAEDANGDGRVDISDPIFLFQFLFRGGRWPPPPYPACSLSPQDDPSQLGCVEPHPLCL